MKDAVSPDGKWRWDGHEWTATDVDGHDYSPGDIVNGHVLGADMQWYPVESKPQIQYDASSGLFYGSLADLLRLGVRSIQQNGWVVTQANEALGLLTFETKMSWGSWSGVTCTLSFQEVANGWWQVTGSGKQNLRGVQLVAFDGGEATSKAGQAVRTMHELVESWNR